MLLRRIRYTTLAVLLLSACGGGKTEILPDGGDVLVPDDGVSDLSDGTLPDGSDSGDAIIEPTGLDPSASSFFIDGDGPYAADGITPTRVIAELIDTEGNPISGATVQISASEEQGVIFMQSSLLSNDQGQAYARLISIDPSVVTLTATVQIDGEEVQIGSDLDVQFTGCTTTADYYRRSLRGPVFSVCSGCHNPWGLAREKDVWQMDNRLDDASVNDTIETLSTLADMEIGTVPLLLFMPTTEAAHFGGELLFEGSDDLAHMENFVARLRESSSSCTPEVEDFFADVIMDDDLGTLKKASLFLLGRAPTGPEAATVSTGGDLKVTIRALLDEPEFGPRVEDLYNDLFLTDRVMGPFKLISHLTGPDFPNRFYFREFQPNKPWYNTQKYTCSSEADTALGAECCHLNNPYPDAVCSKDGYQYDFCQFGDKRAVYGLRREAMALISYVVTQDLPFSEILTADYTVVNPFTARLRHLPDQAANSCQTGTNEMVFDDPCDEHEYRPIQLQTRSCQGTSLENTHPSNAIPHAGVLSTHTLLNRYMTTATNLQRARAKFTYRLFLDIDIESLVQFTVSQAEPPYQNPTMEGKTCSVCHSLMDPMAGAFQKWAANGQVRQGQEWYVCDNDLPDCILDEDCGEEEKCAGGKCVASNSNYDHSLCVRGVGYQGLDLPPEEDKAPLRWMTRQIAEDDRFTYATVKHLFGLLTSKKPLEPPTDLLNPDYISQMKAYLAQEEEIERVRQEFVAEDNNLNLKTAVTEIVTGPYFRAKNGTIPEEDKTSKAIAEIGGGKLITPEQLALKIRDRLGHIWQVIALGRGDALKKPNDGYLLIYGGIDSGSIVDRIREPFPLAANVARRMSIEMACLSVPQDFAYNELDDRRFFTEITMATTPETAEDIANIKGVIQKLVATIWSQDMALDDPEVERIYTLFLEVWTLGQELLNGGEEIADLPVGCHAKYDYNEFKAFADSSNPNRTEITLDPNYTIRSWMAVFSYMLSDAQFLFE